MPFEDMNIDSRIIKTLTTVKLNQNNLITWLSDLHLAVTRVASYAGYRVSSDQEKKDKAVEFFNGKTNAEKIQEELDVFLKLISDYRMDSKQFSTIMSAINGFFSLWGFKEINMQEIQEYAKQKLLIQDQDDVEILAKWNPKVTALPGLLDCIIFELSNLNSFRLAFYNALVNKAKSVLSMTEKTPEDYASKVMFLTQLREHWFNPHFDQLCPRLFRLSVVRETAVGLLATATYEVLYSDYCLVETGEDLIKKLDAIADHCQTIPARASNVQLLKSYKDQYIGLLATHEMNPATRSLLSDPNVKQAIEIPSIGQNIYVDKLHLLDIHPTGIALNMTESRRKANEILTRASKPFNNGDLQNKDAVKMMAEDKEMVKQLMIPKMSQVKLEALVADFAQTNDKDFFLNAFIPFTISTKQFAYLAGHDVLSDELSASLSTRTRQDSIVIDNWTPEITALPSLVDCILAEISGPGFEPLSFNALVEKAKALLLIEVTTDEEHRAKTQFLEKLRFNWFNPNIDLQSVRELMSILLTQAVDAVIKSPFSLATTSDELINKLEDLANDCLKDPKRTSDAVLLRSYKAQYIGLLTVHEHDETKKEWLTTPSVHQAIEFNSKKHDPELKMPHLLDIHPSGVSINKTRSREMADAILTRAPCSAANFQILSRV